METTIRLIEVGDAEVVAAHRARDRAAFTRWEPAQPDTFFTVNGQVARIEGLLAEYRRGERWPGVVLADGEVVGQVTVSTIIRGPFRKAAIGYWIAAPAHGRGHATKAVDLVLRVMVEELGLRRAEAQTQLENLASQRVLRANGFSPHGIAHSLIFIDGGWRDEILWERTLC